MSKYYTPTIEEFHVGFEYIISSKGKNILEEVYGFDNEFEELSFNLRNGYISVKYLDKEDIESLGFKFTDANYISYGKDFKRYIKNVTKIRERYNDHGLKCLIHYNDITKEMIIEAGMFNSFGGNYVFKGYIKNKSELEKLMQQLGINE